MTYDLSAEQRDVRAAVREFGEAELRPVAREYSEAGRYPREIIREAGDYGFLAPFLPTEYGGPGMDALSSMLVTEELWRADSDLGRAVSITGVGSDVLLREGAEWMRERWLPKITSGEAISAIAISEPGHGSDVTGMRTRAERDGDQWVLNGEKTWITNGSVADVVVVFAKTDPAAGRDGISTFLVPTDLEGLQRTPIENMMGHHAADVAELVFEDVHLPAGHLLGEEGDGFDHLVDYLPFGRVDVAAQAVGASQAALEAAVAYAEERDQFGQPIGEFQAVQHSLAEMATGVEAARALTYRAAAEIENGTGAAGRRFANHAKLFATERASVITDEAIQLHGGSGYVTDYPVEKYYRDVRATRIYEGTNAVLKNSIAADLL
jgi:alkylation response protein AidB-like acyl-CoA dehydrogenase